MASPAEEYLARLNGPWCDIGDHLEFLHDTVLKYPRAQVIECGTREGNSTCALLSAVQEVGGHMWSCDIKPQGPWPGGSPFPPEWLELPEWTFLIGDCTSPDILAQMPEQADVVFADTSHTFDQTLAELRAYVPRLKPGGILLEHDTQLGGDANVQQFFPLDHVAGTVAEALDAYCVEADLKWENRYSEPGYSPGQGYGLGCIRMPRKRPGK